MDNYKIFSIISIEILFVLSVLSLTSYGVSGEVWRSTTIGNGTYSSIELDSFGNPRIAYYDSGQGNLVYGRLTKSGWEYEIVDSDKDVGKYNSLVLDKNNIPHISYYDNTNGDLKYAKLLNNRWKIKTVQEDGNVGKFTSIDLDADGHSHISYYDSSNGNLMHARRGVELWRTETVDAEGDVGKYTSISVGDIVHISYYNADNKDLKYARYTGDAWETKVVDREGNVGQYTSIGIDFGLTPHILYFSGDGELKHTYRSGGNWKKEFVEKDVSISGDVTLNIFSNYIYMIYSGKNNCLTYAVKDGDEGKKKIVDNSSFVSMDTSLDIGKYGRAYVTYPDVNTNNLKYLTYYTVPSKPTNLRALAGDGHIKLQWTEPENDGGKPIEEHYLYRVKGNGNKHRIASLDSPETTYLDSSVENGRYYRYLVTALNVIGESKSSNQVKVKPTAKSPLGGGDLEEVEEITTTTTLEKDDEGERETVSRENIFEDENSGNWTIYILMGILVIVLIIFIWKRKS